MLPEKFIASLAGLPGFDPAAFIKTHQTQADFTSLRINPYKKFDTAIHPFLHAVEPIPWCAQGHYVSGRPSFVLDPLWHAGAYYVQEASSMFLDWIIRQIAAPDQYYKVLDLCAAPGARRHCLRMHLKMG